MLTFTHIRNFQISVLTWVDRCVVLLIPLPSLIALFSYCIWPRNDDAEYHTL